MVLMQGHHRNHIVYVAGTVAIGIALLFIASAPLQEASAMKCVKQWDDPDLGGPCWYCVSSSGLHHTFLGPGCA
jgi:hypothetical protein